MAHPLSRRIILACVVLLLSLAVVGTGLAQDATPPAPPAPACVADEQTACVKIVFYPATLVGDLFLVTPAAGETPATETPTTQLQQSSLYVTFANPAAGQTIDVVVKNIHDGGQGEGTLYQYPNMPKTVSVPYAAGVTTTTTLYPVKTYIRGKVAAKCDIRSVAEGDDVACLVSVDGTAQTFPAPAPTPLPDGSLPPPAPPGTTLAAGQTATLILDPGPHDIKFDLTGASIGLWAPPSLTKTVTVTAGSYPQLATATFLKAGHIVATLAQAADGWVGDFFLDGTQVGTQVGSIDQWVAANKTHKIDVRNIAKTGSPGIHPYYDGSGSAYTTSGATSNVSIAMNKVPSSAIVNPCNSCPGAPTTFTTNDQIGLRLDWAAITPTLAEQNADHINILASLDGVAIGDTHPYRQPAVIGFSATACGESAWVPCYVIVWEIPLGKLPAGPHLVHYDLGVDTPIFNGWMGFNAGYASFEDAFTVTPVTP